MQTDIAVTINDSSEFKAAKIIHDYWEGLINEFLFLTLKGKPYFEQRKFKELFGFAQQRYNLYGIIARKAESDIQDLLGDKVADIDMWIKIKSNYRELTQHRYDRPNTETFYNSVTRKIFNKVNIGFDERFEFFNTEDFHFVEFTEPKVYRTIKVDMLSPKVLKDILLSLDFQADWENIDRDAKLVFDDLAPTIIFQKNNLFLEEIELLNTIFYRNRGAFVVGKFRYKRWVMPFAIPILNEECGLFADAVISNASELSIIFSFTRASFMAYTHKPVELIDYLKTMLPHKPLSELYDAIGYFRNGKTLMYRDLMSYIRNHDDQFIIAPGIKGMVMCVFTLKNYPFVFKIIKDKFDNPKNISRNQVIKKYEEVELNDRVGRMAYAHLFEHLEFPLHLFSQELIDELKAVAQQTVRFIGDKVLVSHCYMERKMTPLNIYLDSASRIDKVRAIVDWGYCIKELAAANIFPGDLLPKNFGVTRHGRVIFYDYDEICKITECNFRRLPDPVEEEDELYGGYEAPFSVDPGDIFPQEFKNFMIPDGPVGDIFMAEHEDLFDPKSWRNTQKAIDKGEYLRFFAYDRNKRFKERQQNYAQVD